MEFQMQGLCRIVRVGPWLNLNPPPFQVTGQALVLMKGAEGVEDVIEVQQVTELALADEVVFLQLEGLG